MDVVKPLYSIYLSSRPNQGSWPMFTDQDLDQAICLGIIHGLIAPDANAHSEGYKAHADGKGFHECSHAQASSLALSWRIGWNDRALQQRT